MKRVVLDTNVVLASERSGAATSPNREILGRWRAGEFLWLYSRDTVLEYSKDLTQNRWSILLDHIPGTATLCGVINTP